jgi:hypothetical protein
MKSRLAQIPAERQARGFSAILAVGASANKDVSGPEHLAETMRIKRSRKDATAHTAAAVRADGNWNGARRSRRFTAGMLGSGQIKANTRFGSDDEAT